MMIQIDAKVLGAEQPACRLAVRRAEEWERESRIYGAILCTLVAVIALAIAITVAMAVAGKPTAAIVTALGGIVGGAAMTFVVKRRREADRLHEDAINDAKRVCDPATVRSLT